MKTLKPLITVAVGISVLPVSDLGPKPYAFQVVESPFVAEPPLEYHRTIPDDSIREEQASFSVPLPYLNQRQLFYLMLAGNLGLMSLVIAYNRRKTNDFARKIFEAEQKALRAQLNPHFVFNALNSVQKQLSRSGAHQANMYLSKFGRLIRIIFDNSGSRTISIDEEMTIMNVYLELESMRFDKKFSYSIEVHPEIDRFGLEIPSMILQPYLENAVWHGLMHKEENGSISISIEPLEGGILCSIEDDGIGRKKAAEIKAQSNFQHKSAGLNITEQRLKILSAESRFKSYAKVTDLEDENGTGLGTRVEIRLETFQY